jgi:hypothetical protein
VAEPEVAEVVAQSEAVVAGVRDRDLVTIYLEAVTERLFDFLGSLAPRLPPGSVEQGRFHRFACDPEASPPAAPSPP